MGTYLSTPKTEKETEYGTGKGLAYGMSGMQGWRRTMEDAHICTIALNNDEDLNLFAVFDGHGGAEVAKFCAKHLGNELVRLPTFETGDYDSALKAVFHQMDTLLQDEAHASELAALRGGGSSHDSSESGDAAGGHGGEGGGEDSAIWKQIQQFRRLVIETQQDGIQLHAGCTAVVALKQRNMLYVANAGIAVALSEDHKPLHEGERARIEAAGGAVTDVGGVARINGNLNLSRAIGDLKYKTNEALPKEAQIITAHPDVRVFELTEDDRFFVLACDGVWDVLSNQEAVNLVDELLAQGTTPMDVASAVIDRCLATDPKDSFGVGCDNMTCIVINFQHDRPATDSGSVPSDVAGR